MADNEVVFTLRLQDLMSGALHKTQKSAQGAFRVVDTTINATKKKLQEAAKETGGLGRRLDEIAKPRKLVLDTSSVKNAKREVDQLENKVNNVSSNGGNRLRSFFGKAALFGGLTAAAYGAGSLGLSTLKQGASAEQDIIGLTTFVGEQNAKNLYKELQQDAARTPFVTRDLLGTTRALISTGVTPEAARKDAWNLANAVSAVGGGSDELSRMAVNMQQIRTQGKAMGMDIRQFAMAGINIYQLMADATGKTLKDAKKIVPTYELLSFALNKAAGKGGLYSGALERQGKSIQGKWSTIRDYFQIGQQSLTLSQEQSILRIEDMIIAGVKKIPAIVEQLEPVVTGAVKSFEEFIPLIKDHAEAIWNAAKPVLAFLGSDEIKSLAKNAFQLTTDAVNLLTPAIDAATAVLKPFAQSIANIAGFIHGLVPEGGNKYELVQDKKGNWVFQEKQKAPGSAASDALPIMPSITGWVAKWFSPKTIQSVDVTDQFYGRPGYSDIKTMAQGFYDAKQFQSRDIKTGAINGAPPPPDYSPNGLYGGDDLTEKGDTITGGGKRSIVMNFNKELVGKIEQHITGGNREGAYEVRRIVEEELLSIVNSLKD